MSQTRQIVCISCPVGCRLTVEYGGPADEVNVTGNRCPRGDIYGREEILAPKRVVTAVVPTDSPSFPCAPVRTEEPLPRELATELLAALYSRVVSLPVRQGDACIEDFHGMRVVYTRSLPPREVG